MKIISDRMHGALDYLTVLIFALAPSLIGFTGVGATISYALAIIHLAMTLTTNMPLGVVKIIPMKLHSIVEMVVGPVLLLVGLLAPTLPTASRSFFVVMGVVIFAVWGLSSYGRPDGQENPKRA
jgi:hypothetical protein